MAYAGGANQLGLLAQAGGGNMMTGMKNIGERNRLMNQQMQQQNELSALKQPYEIAKMRQEAMQRQAGFTGQTIQGADNKTYQVIRDPNTGELSVGGLSQQGQPQQPINPRANPMAAQQAMQPPVNPRANPGAMAQPSTSATPGYAGPVQQQQPQGGFNTPRPSVPKHLEKYMDAGKLSTQTFTVQDIMAAAKKFEENPTMGSAHTSAASKIYQNGTAIMGTSGAEVKVIDPAGNLVTDPEQRAKVVKAAMQADIEYAATKSGSVKAADAAIKVSTESFERIVPIKRSIANIDKAIALLPEDGSGANVGPVVSMLPSFQSASVELDNIQGQMGLDVIGQTTFGALSESELKFALATALPTDLKPATLRDWLERKKAGQTKLADYLENVAVYLGTPGNTIPKWLKAQRELQGRQEPGAATEPYKVGNYTVTPVS